MPAYTLDWIIKHEGAVAGAKAIRAELMALDQLCDRLGPKLKALAEGAAKPMSSASRAAKGLAANLAALQAQAQQTTPALGAVGPAAASLGRASGGASPKVAKLNAALLALAGAAVGLGVLKEAIGGLAESLKAARQYAQETAEANIKLKDSLRELRSMDKGRTSDQVVGDVADLMLKTGATKEEAGDFNLQFKSAVFAAQQSGHWKLNEKQTDEAKVQALRFAVANQIDPGTFGKTMATIGVNEDVTSVGQILGKIAGAHQMAAEGVGDYDAVYQVGQKLRGEMVSPEKIGPDGKPIKGSGMNAFKSEEEMMAAIGTATTDSGTPAAATQSMRQIWREMNRFKDGDAGKTLDRLGIKPTDDFVSRLEKMAPLIEDAQKPGGMGASAALKQAGFGNSAANMKLVTAVKRRSIYRQRQDRMQKAADPEELMADLDRFQAENPARFAAAERGAVEILKGREDERYVTAMKSGRTSLMGRGEALPEEKGRTWKQLAKDGFGVLDWVPGTENADVRESRTEARKRLLEADPTLAKRFPQLDPKANIGADLSHEEFRDILNQVPAATFKKAFGDTPADVQKRIDAMRAGAGPAGLLPAGIAPAVARIDPNAPEQRPVMALGRFDPNAPEQAPLPAIYRVGQDAAGPGIRRMSATQAGPQSSIDATKLNEAADKLLQFANQMGGEERGAGRGAPRSLLNDYGPPPDLQVDYSPYLPGSGGGYG